MAKYQLLYSLECHVTEAGTSEVGGCDSLSCFHYYSLTSLISQCRTSEGNIVYFMTWLKSEAFLYDLKSAHQGRAEVKK